MVSFLHIPHQTAVRAVCPAHLLLQFKLQHSTCGPLNGTRPRHVASQQATPEHASASIYNRSISSKCPVDEAAVHRSSGRHVECYGLIVLHVGKGSIYCDGNWDFLIARSTILHTHCFFGPSHTHSTLQPSDPP